MYKDTDFERMKYKIHKLKDPLDDPNLQRIDFNFSKAEFWSDKNKIIKYLCYCYDSGSPYVMDIQDIKERKRLALSEAKITNQHVTEQLTELSNELYLELLIAIVRGQKSRLYRLIVANEAALSELESDVMRNYSGDKDKDLVTALKNKADLLKAMEEIGDRLDSYYAKFFNHEIEVAERTSFTPEKMRDIV